MLLSYWTICTPVGQLCDNNIKDLNKSTKWAGPLSCIKEKHDPELLLWPASASPSGWEILFSISSSWTTSTSSTAPLESLAPPTASPALWISALSVLASATLNLLLQHVTASRTHWPQQGVTLHMLKDLSWSTVVCFIRLSCRWFCLHHRTQRSYKICQNRIKGWSEAKSLGPAVTCSFSTFVPVLEQEGIFVATFSSDRILN